VHFERFGLERFFALHEHTVRFMLTASDPETLTIGEVLALDGDEEAALEDFGNLRLGYAEPRGSRPLREAIAALYTAQVGDAPGREVATRADDVLVCAGAQEPILLFALATLEPGDEVIVQTPCYQSHLEVMRWAGATPIPCEVREADAWTLDPDRVAALITPRTKALVLNTPHNPTGATMSHEAQAALVALADRHGLYVLADEVYRGLELDLRDRLPPWSNLYPRAVSLGALAKGWGLGGLRIGWCATRDQTLLATLESLKDYTTICSPSPSEHLAAIALRHTDTLWARTRARLAANIAAFEAFLARHESLSWIRPRGGTMGFMRIVDPRGATAWCADVLAKEGVLIAPGPLFGAPDTHARIGFGRADFTTALAALERALT